MNSNFGRENLTAMRIIARKPNNIMNMQLGHILKQITQRACRTCANGTVLSYLIHTFLRAYDDNEVSVKVTGSRRLDNGLVVPGTFKARTPSRAIATKFEQQILWVKQLCTHMDISLKTLRTLP